MNDWSADRPATDDDQLDPRLLRSRKRLLDAATHLLSTGGVEAVTVEAVTRMSKVARATLYRHFGGTAQLLAASFERLLPRVEVSTASGSVRDQLIALLTAQADLIDQAPLNITTLAWLSIGSVGGSDPADSAAITSLRSRVIEEYRQPFDRILTQPDVRAQLGNVDTTFAIVQLLGPVVFARLTGLCTVDHDGCVQLVDDFLAARKQGGEPIPAESSHGLNRPGAGGSR
ncbi:MULTISPECIES: TetR/AcrR family transcriptional regulator [Dietzia]|uniref:TetR/AcrR family transcriptional regulator n=1 Tax=Dietzia TaxID=37914 RepID=UPI000D31B7A7|nr:MULTISPECIES: TetR/AcrR family transcriptional regulator [Dietzia]MBB1027003.1 helix-turn-helix transcriptional regulator [Dietzia sp. DQ11-38-2]MBB1032480.1 helix-turn-helix transcriptional regulator [Dietzia sp. SLG310A2-38A2]MBB1039989.1 helix-turn-helix transcriptional regulator [Dietzia sp. Cai40]MBB1044132.1 helix-turn-helix transcriptional regulator [Dietzia sp. DQ11-44]MBB1055632.1 helix-turn-helix transcriptional regulator [Dietzia sp. B44]